MQKKGINVLLNKYRCNFIATITKQTNLGEGWLFHLEITPLSMQLFATRCKRKSLKIMGRAIFGCLINELNRLESRLTKILLNIPFSLERNSPKQQ